MATVTASRRPKARRGRLTREWIPAGAGGTAIIPAIADTSLKPQRRNNWAARISCGRPFGGSSDRNRLWSEQDSRNGLYRMIFSFFVRYLAMVHLKLWCLSLRCYL